MDRRKFLVTSSASVAALSTPQVLRAQGPAPAKLFRWVPHADLTILDPMFSTVFITNIHSQLVFDTLYGLDNQYQPHPQMAAGHVMDPSGLVWKIMLRDDLKFHDGSPVRAADAVASLNRWAKKDLMGRSLMEATQSLTALDDKTIEFKLTKPFPLLLHAIARPTGSMACIMPEKLALTPDNVQVKVMNGSGPFRFIHDQWVSGSQAVYQRFADYVPTRDKRKPEFTSGPKLVHIEQVRWQIIPDRATSIAALQNNEVDGVEQVDSDFLPILKKDKNITLIKRTLPSISLMRFNHLHAPFNNKLMRQAVLAAVSQTEYMMGMNGPDFPEYWDDKCGVFVPGSPMDSKAGMEKITGKRDLARARAMIKEAGYKGETVVILDPVDYPVFHTAALMTVDLFKKLGIKTDLQAMNWGTLMQRRNSQEPPSAGGWNVTFTAITGSNNLDPAGHLAIRGSGQKAWFGWPTSERIEQLRLDWFNAKSLEEQKKICSELQLQVFEDVPYVPLGATYQVSALRKGWVDFQEQMPLFYTLRKA
jgi:peptide/nickel transport system substrate-binding protein